jgi:hypothetical protein
MWKVVVTEIQDANTLEPLAAPPGAFFVSTERFARTVEELDLQALINTIDRMQSPQAFRREDRPVSGERTPRPSGSSRSAALREAHSASVEPSRSIAIAAKLLSKTDP